MSKTKEDFLQYGMDSENQLVHIDDAIHGAKCALVCPGCGGNLVAKNKGRVVRHHFSHAVEIPGDLLRPCGETVLHLVAKRVILKQSCLMFPNPYSGEIFYRFDKRIEFVDLRSIDNVALAINKTREEYFHKPSGLRFDCLAHIQAVGQNVLGVAIEVRVTHEIGDQKREALKSMDISCLQIDCRHLLGKRFGEHDILMALKKPEVIHVSANLQALMKSKLNIINMFERNDALCAKEYQDYIDRQLSGCNLRVPSYVQIYRNGRRKELKSSEKKEIFVSSLVSEGCMGITFYFESGACLEAKFISRLYDHSFKTTWSSADIDIDRDSLVEPFDLFDIFSNPSGVQFKATNRWTEEVHKNDDWYPKWIERKRQEVKTQAPTSPPQAAPAHKTINKPKEIENIVLRGSVAKIFSIFHGKESDLNVEMVLEAEKLLVFNFWKWNASQEGIAKHLFESEKIKHGFEIFGKRVCEFNAKVKEARENLGKVADQEYLREDVQRLELEAMGLAKFDLMKWCMDVAIAFDEGKSKVMAFVGCDNFEYKWLFCNDLSSNDRKDLYEMIEFICFSPLSRYESFEKMYRSEFFYSFKSYSSLKSRAIVGMLFENAGSSMGASLSEIKENLRSTNTFDIAINKFDSFKDKNFDSKYLQDLVSAALTAMTRDYEVDSFVDKAFSVLSRRGAICLKGDKVYSDPQYIKMYVEGFKQ